FNCTAKSIRPLISSFVKSAIFKKSFPFKFIGTLSFTNGVVIAIPLPSDKLIVTAGGPLLFGLLYQSLKTHERFLLRSSRAIEMLMHALVRHCFPLYYKSQMLRLTSSTLRFL